ncbi:MAG: MFS transporter [Chitinivorax sp.]
MKRLPATVVVLGLVSLLMDTASELLHSLLPVFLTVTLGASMATVGLIQGVAEALAALTKVFSGAWSDHRRQRKPMILLGYGLAALSKPLFPLASAPLAVFLARALDRIGKGIRGAPRDALIADLTPESQRGAAFGLRQALDTVGAVLGPLLALCLLTGWGMEIRAVMWLAVLPAGLAVLLLWLAVREPEAAPERLLAASPLSRAALRQVPLRLWLGLLLAAVLAKGQFSDAFLILRLQDLGWQPAQAPLTLVVLNLAYALFAYPAGLLADRFGATRLLLLGWVMLCLAYLLLAVATDSRMGVIAIVLAGLYMALTQGLMAAQVANMALPTMRGTMFGLFNLLCGLVLLLVNSAGGWLWQQFGPATMFAVGAALALLAQAGVCYLPRLMQRE